MDLEVLAIVCYKNIMHAYCHLQLMISACYENIQIMQLYPITMDGQSMMTVLSERRKKKSGQCQTQLLLVKYASTCIILHACHN